MKFVVGNWYNSVDQVRRPFGQYFRGILYKKNKIAITVGFHGVRRKHYTDGLDFKRMQLVYLGQGHKGNQQFTAGNRVLVDASVKKTPIDVFFDCGDILAPKHLLYAGKWVIEKNEYRSAGGRKVFRFVLKPTNKEIVRAVRLIFSDRGEDLNFERALSAFSAHRASLYRGFPDIMRARDSIAGEIGEYFAIKLFNKQRQSTIIRLRNSYKDLDAVQLKTGKRYAIKAIGKPLCSTSNIWSKDVVKAIDYFLIVYIEPDKLKPVYVVQMSSKKAKQEGFLFKDMYQKSSKLKIDERFLRAAKHIYGNPLSKA